MISMRLVLVIAVTLVAMQSASADQKKESKKTIDVQSYSWGVTNSGSLGSATGGGSSSKATGITNLSPNQNIGTSTTRHK
jgi:hypothetical protein